MTATRPTLLMTRPLAASERFLVSLDSGLRNGLRVLVSPLMQIDPRDLPDMNAAKGLIFTSRNGVEVASGQMSQRALPVFCVGRATTKTARELGWQAVQVGRNAADLVAALPGLEPATPLMHLHGTHTRGDVASVLTRAGIPTAAHVIYEQPARPLVPDAIAALRQGTVIAPLFSPRSAALFAGQVDRAAELHVIALSVAVASACEGLAPASMTICAHPEAAEMRKRIAEVAGTCLRH